MTYKWTIEVVVDPIWVADGFDLTPERAQRMLRRELDFAHEHEVTATVTEAPDPDAIAVEQGYASAADRKARR